MDIPTVVAKVRNSANNAEISTIITRGHYETIVFADAQYKFHYSERYPIWDITPEDAEKTRADLMNSPLEERVGY